MQAAARPRGSRRHRGWVRPCGVQPAGVAAGTIAMVGTDAGRDAIAALSVIPACFSGRGDQSAGQTFARRGHHRCFFRSPPQPMKNSGRELLELRYFGARVRFNWWACPPEAPCEQRTVEGPDHKMAVTGARPPVALKSNVQACSTDASRQSLDDAARRVARRLPARHGAGAAYQR
jgi:hypothetical protein